MSEVVSLCAQVLCVTYMLCNRKKLIGSLIRCLSLFSRMFTGHIGVPRVYMCAQFGVSAGANDHTTTDTQTSTVVNSFVMKFSGCFSCCILCSL